MGYGSTEGSCWSRSCSVSLGACVPLGCLKSGGKLKTLPDRVVLNESALGETLSATPLDSL